MCCILERLTCLCADERARHFFHLLLDLFFFPRFICVIRIFVWRKSFFPLSTYSFNASLYYIDRGSFLTLSLSLVVSLSLILIFFRALDLIFILSPLFRTAVRKTKCKKPSCRTALISRALRARYTSNFWSFFPRSILGINIISRICVWQTK